MSCHPAQLRPRPAPPPPACCRPGVFTTGGAALPAARPFPHPPSDDRRPTMVACRAVHVVVWPAGRSAAQARRADDLQRAHAHLPRGQGVHYGAVGGEARDGALQGRPRARRRRGVQAAWARLGRRCGESGERAPAGGGRDGASAGTAPAAHQGDAPAAEEHRRLRPERRACGGAGTRGLPPLQVALCEQLGARPSCGPRQLACGLARPLR